MSAKWSVLITSPLGDVLAQIKNFIAFDFVRIENDVGAATLTLPGELSEGFFETDNMLEFWRTLDNGLPYRDTETAWFIRRPRRVRNGKRRDWEIEAYCLNNLWKRRIIDYNEGNAYTSKLDELDNMGKAVMRENYGTLATDATRRIDTYLGVQADTSAAPIARLSFARDKVLDTLQMFSNTALTLGTYLVFDNTIVRETQPRFEFRSYIGQRGTDRRANNQLIFSSDRGNLDNVVVEWNSVDEVTRAVIGGQGVGTTQAVARENNTTRQAVSPFNLIEAWENHTAETDAAGLQAAGQALLSKNRARQTIAGTIKNAPGTVYGVDWGWGDRVRARDGNDSFDARLSTVRVKVDQQNGEVVTADLRGEAVTE